MTGELPCRRNEAHRLDWTKVLLRMIELVLAAGAVVEIRDARLHLEKLSHSDLLDLRP